MCWANHTFPSWPSNPINRGQFNSHSQYWTPLLPYDQNKNAHTVCQHSNDHNERSKSRYHPANAKRKIWRLLAPSWTRTTWCAARGCTGTSLASFDQSQACQHRGGGGRGHYDNIISSIYRSNISPWMRVWPICVYNISNNLLKFVLI